CWRSPRPRVLSSRHGAPRDRHSFPTRRSSDLVWTDSHWQTPDKADLIIYEMSVYGFTEGDPDVEHPGTFAGVTERIRMGYFNDLDRKSTRLNSSHVKISYAVFCLKKKNA